MSIRRRGEPRVRPNSTFDPFFAFSYSLLEELKYEIDVISVKNLLVFCWLFLNRKAVSSSYTVDILLPGKNKPPAVEWHQNCFINEDGTALMEKEERRSERRLDRKLLVNISIDGLESMGLTSNISKTGMFVSSPEVFPINSEVSILLGIADETFSLKGLVMWTQKLSDSPSTDVQVAAGIKIIEAPEEYFNFVEKEQSKPN
jgi:hypothetical protein